MIFICLTDFTTYSYLSYDIISFVSRKANDFIEVRVHTVHNNSFVHGNNPYKQYKRV